MNRLRALFQLTKPGIIFDNLMTAVGGFVLASKGHAHVRLLIATLAGTGLVIAAACVYNNIMDRDLDRKMQRTKKRALVSGAISARAAFVYASVLLLTGFAALGFEVNKLVVIIGLIGFADYVGLYDIAKRRFAAGALIGSISGATPILAGYCAASGKFDLGGALLFIVMVIWQMPHFYAIGMRRAKDYKAAGVPVLPLTHGFRLAKIRILAYIVAFALATLACSLFGYTGWVFAVCMSVLSIAWFFRGLRGFHTLDDTIWARGMFLFSLVVVTSFAALLIANPWLP